MLRVAITAPKDDSSDISDIFVYDAIDRPGADASAHGVLIHGLTPASLLPPAQGGAGGSGEFEDGGAGGAAGQNGAPTPVTGVAGGAHGATPGAAGGNGSSTANTGGSGGGGGADGVLGVSFVGGKGGNGGDAGTAGGHSVGGGGGGGGGAGLRNTFSEIQAGGISFTGGNGGNGGKGGHNNQAGDTQSAGGGDGGDGGAGFALGSGQTLIFDEGTIAGGLGGNGGAGSDPTADAPLGAGGNGGAGGVGIDAGDGNTVTIGSLGIVRGGSGGFGGSGSPTGAAGDNAVGVIGSNLALTNAGFIAGATDVFTHLLADAVQFTGGVNTLTVSDGTDVGAFRGAIAVTGTLNIDPGAEAAAENLILKDGAGGPGTIVKVGNGELILSGTFTYTGGTTVSAGVLDIAATMNGNGNVTVAPGATFILDDGTRSTSNKVVIAANAGTVELHGGSAADAFSFSHAAFHVTDIVNGGTGSALDTLSITGGGTLTSGVLAGISHVEILDFSKLSSLALLVPDALAASSDNGHRLTVIGSATGANDLDASTLTAGHTVSLIGGNGQDTLTGTAGNDILNGGRAADTLRAEGGHNVIVYASVFDSTSTSFDTIVDFNFASDTFNIPGSVSAIDPTVSGALSSATFNTDLATALASKLGALHAILFHATSGTLSGDDFLVVDLNNHHGYQSGGDLVIELFNHSGTLTTSDFV